MSLSLHRSVFTFRSHLLSSRLMASCVIVALLSCVAEAQSNARTKTLFSPQQTSSATPPSPNPYLSYLPTGVKPDVGYWNSRMKVESASRFENKLSTAAAPLINLSETESNDTQATANILSGFGTSVSSDPSATLSGSFSPDAVPAVAGPFAEDDGSIPLANTLALTPGTSAIISATLGDGPHAQSGSRNGDFDFYRLASLTPGQIVTVDISTMLGTTFDSYVAAWDSSGTFLAANDDENFAANIFDSFLWFTVPASGDYYFSVGSFASEVPSDPFDSSSGPGVGSEDAYEVTIGLEASDADYFSFEVKSGDVISAAGFGGAQQVSLFDPLGVERVGSAIDHSSVYPSSSPLASGGNASIAYVAEIPGTFALRVLGTGGANYSVTLQSFRPALESAPLDTTQILFIDFDGETFDTSVLGGTGVATASPLAAFLTSWGLTSNSEVTTIRAILDTVTENIMFDIATKGNSPRFGLQILNSLDDPDPFGQPNVSRVIVGGTIAETGLNAVGMAESIDVGNFDGEQTAIVQLDTLSAPSFNISSLNSIPRGGGVSMIELVGVGIGNLVAHQAGHFFGDFHTDVSSAAANLMDQSGDLPGMIGVGADGIFGTGDDLDTDFGVDMYAPSEGFTGSEDTLNELAFSLASTVANNLITSVPNRPFIEHGRLLRLIAPAPARSPIQWRVDKGAGLVDVVDDGRITGSNTAVLRFTPAFESDSGVYVVNYEDGSTKLIVDSLPFGIIVLPKNSIPASGMFGIVFAIAVVLLLGGSRLSRLQQRG